LCVLVCSVAPIAGIRLLSLHDALPISAALSRHDRRGLFALLRSAARHARCGAAAGAGGGTAALQPGGRAPPADRQSLQGLPAARSEEHTSELQSRENLVCRRLLEKKKT